jgi:hypothetical protein
MAAVRAGDVGGHGAIALGTGLEQWGAPPIGTAAHLALHLGHSSLGDSHGLVLLSVLLSCS